MFLSRLYTPEQLKQLDHSTLYKHFRYARIEWNSRFPGPDDYQEFDSPESEHAYHAESDRLGEYLETVKAELQSRPYLKFTKKAVKTRRAKELANLRGNRQQPRNKNHRKAI